MIAMRILADTHQGRLSRRQQRSATTRVPRVRASPVRRAVTAELRYFLDSADAGAWADFLPTGIFYGVTTNPLILQRDGVQCTRQAIQVSRRLGSLAQAVLPSGHNRPLTTGTACDSTTLQDLAHRAADFGMQELQVQTWGEDWQSMADNGLALANIYPPSDDGLQLVSLLLLFSSGERECVAVASKSRTCYC